jgi:hypothetical protein
MIQSFKCVDTRRIWKGESSRKFPGEVMTAPCASCACSMPQRRWMICEIR